MQKMRVCNGFCAHNHISKLLLLCEVVTVCHTVTQWVVLPTKCTRRYGGRSAVCFHTPTVRRANHHNGWERDYDRDLSGVHFYLFICTFWNVTQGLDKVRSLIHVNQKSIQMDAISNKICVTLPSALGLKSTWC